MLLRQTLSLNLPRELVAEIRARAALLPQKHGSLAHVAEVALRIGLKATAQTSITRGGSHATRRTRGARA